MDGATLRAWRIAHGLSRQQAATELRVPVRTLEALEVDRYPQSPLWGPLSRLIEVLDRTEV